jgi:hypothetical protein
MNSDGRGRNRTWINSRYYPDNIYLYELRKTKNISNRIRRRPCRAQKNSGTVPKLSSHFFLLSPFHKHSTIAHPSRQLAHMVQYCRTAAQELIRLASQRGNPGSIPDQVMRHRNRFPSSTSVSLANPHSTNCSPHSFLSSTPYSLHNDSIVK